MRIGTQRLRQISPVLHQTGTNRSTGATLQRCRLIRYRRIILQEVNKVDTPVPLSQTDKGRIGLVAIISRLPVQPGLGKRIKVVSQQNREDFYNSAI